MVPFFYLFIIFLKGGGVVELIFNVSEISDPFEISLSPYHLNLFWQRFNMVTYNYPEFN